MSKEDPSKNPPAPPANPRAANPPAASDEAKNDPPAAGGKKGKPKPGKVEVLSEKKRGGKTVQVLTDGVRVWKEAK